MKFKLNEKQRNTNWEQKFVLWKKTQDNYFVVLEHVWVKWRMHLDSGHWIYRVEK